VKQSELEFMLSMMGTPAVWDRRLTDDEIKQLLKYLEERYGPIPAKGDK
jgi:hypothetical protein